MLIKEDVIILRTIIHEFGDLTIKEDFPYENLEVKGLEEAGGSEIPVSIDFSKCAFFSSDEEGHELSIIGYEFYLMGEYDIKCNGFIESSNAENLVIVEGKQKGVNRENENDIAIRDRNVFLKGISKSDFFINLRMGLYYKGLDDYEKAIKHLEEAHKIFCKAFDDTIVVASNNALDWYKQFYDIDNSDFKEDYTYEKHGVPLEVHIPSELRVSLVESPSFHLGEIYNYLANEYFTGYQSSREISMLKNAEENYAKAVYWLEECSKWDRAIHYGEDIKDENRIKSLKRLGAIRFPVSNFIRNSYWEINYLTSTNQLKRIEEEKYVSTIKMLDRPDPAHIELEVSKAISQERKKYKPKEEKLKRYEAIFPDPESIPIHLIMELKLNSIIHESHENLYWFDKHFNWEGLDYLSNSNLSGKVKVINIIAGPYNIDEQFRSNFESLKKEMLRDGTIIELRVITQEHILNSRQRPHARWLITDNNAYNVPPIYSIIKRQIDTINKEDDKGRVLNYVNRLWTGGIDILTGDWKEIQKVRVKIREVNR